MTAKDFLLQLKDIDDLIKAKQEEIVRADAMGMCISHRIKEVCVQKSQNYNRISDSAVAVVELEDEIAHQIVKLLLVKKKASMILDKVTPLRFQTVLLKYYFQNKTLEQTAEEMNVSYQWVCELHKKALKEYQRFMPDNMASN